MKVGVALVSLLCLHSASSLHIGHFSQEFLDLTKINNPGVADLFSRIIEKFDIVGFNGVSDPKAIDVLLQVLRRRNQNYRATFSPVLSQHEFSFIPILKESFGFIYRKQVVSISPLLRDRPTGAISALIHDMQTGREFVYSIVHLIDDDVVAELAGIPDLYTRITEDFNCESVLFSGHFNTVAKDISKLDFNLAAVSQDPRFKWFIDYDDVTIDIPQLRGAANRFLAAGDIKDWIVFTNIINTRTYYGLTDEQLSATSPFYPIEIDLEETGYFSG